MPNPYFNHTENRIPAGSRALDSQINNIADEVALGFDRLPTEAELKEGRAAYAVATGTENAQVITLPYTPTLGDGMNFYVKFVATNTGGTTLNVNATGAKNVVNSDGTTLTAGAIVSGTIGQIAYDLTNDRYILISNNSAWVGGGTVTGDNLLTDEDTGNTVRSGNSFTDWDDVHPGGVYFMGQGKTNQPANVEFHLWHTTENKTAPNTFATQMAISTSNATTLIYSRNCESGVWRAWVLISGGGDGGSAQQANHYKASWPQFYDFIAQFDFSESLSSTDYTLDNTYRTVTKTGGGGDVIWTALDIVPSTAKGLIVRLSISTKSAGSGTNVLYIRPIGGDQDPGSHNTFVRIDHFANDIDMEAGWAIFPFDGNGFEGLVASALGGSTGPPRIKTRYRGFIE